MAHRDDSEFDFDSWASLAFEYPLAFEDARRRVIDSLIEDAPEACRSRLRGLQWQIDQRRRCAKTPLAACAAVSDMMWHQILSNRGLLAQISQLDRPDRIRYPAEIIEFRRSETAADTK